MTETFGLIASQLTKPQEEPSPHWKPHDKNLIPGSKRHVLQRSFRTSVSVSRVTLRREAFENVK